MQLGRCRFSSICQGLPPARLTEEAAQLREGAPGPGESTRWRHRTAGHSVPRPRSAAAKLSNYGEGPGAPAHLLVFLKANEHKQKM